MAKTEYANGTSLTTVGPYSLYCGARALCPDGIVRSMSRVAHTGDTWFSLPASVNIGKKRRKVSGYVTGDLTGHEGTICFVPYKYGANHDAIPDYNYMAK
jgi:hypothetical protein